MVKVRTINHLTTVRYTAEETLDPCLGVDGIKMPHIQI